MPGAQAAADERELGRLFRRVEMRLGVLTHGREFVELRPAVERMRNAARRESDPARRLELALDCADEIRPAAVAIIGRQGADFALPAGLLSDFRGEASGGES